MNTYINKVFLCNQACHLPMTDQSIMQLMEVLVIIVCVYHEWKQNVRFFEKLKISGFAQKQNGNLKSLAHFFIAVTRKYLLQGYILGVLTHTTAWDQQWGGDESLGFGFIIE